MIGKIRVQHGNQEEFLQEVYEISVNSNYIKVGIKGSKKAPLVQSNTYKISIESSLPVLKNICNSKQLVCEDYLFRKDPFYKETICNIAFFRPVDNEEKYETNWDSNFSKSNL